MRSPGCLNVDIHNYVWFTYKFGGHWTYTKRYGQKRYDAYKQKTVKLQLMSINFKFIEEQVKVICPWIRGYDYHLYHEVHGSGPKDFVLIKTDTDVVNMIAQANEKRRIDLVVETIEDCYSQGRDTSDQSHMFVHLGSSSQHVSDNNEGHTNFEDSTNIGREESNMLFIGARFNDSISFRHALRSEAITKNFGLRITAGNRSRVVAVCSHRGCSWRIRASLCGDGSEFEVKKLTPEHSCPGVNRAGNKLATSSWVAQEIQDIIRKDPNIPPKQINMNLENKYGLSLSYTKLWRSREQARNCLFGSVDDNFKWVSALKAELMARNPGSHITYTCDELDNSFQRFYVSFKVCVDGFLAGCRPLIGLDACHLKSKYLGVLLSATSLDGDNGLFTVAFAVAESESKKTWTWFMENLATSIGYELYPLAFISDMEKGLGEAIRLIFPDAEHRVCLRHLWKNLKKYFHCNDSQRLRSLVWSAANSYTVPQFQNKLNEIFDISPQIHSYLTSLPYKWSKSTFSSDIKNHYNTNNMAESFNAWIGEARSKPAVDLVDTIRGMLMQQRADRKRNSSCWRGLLVPHAEEYIRDITTKKEQFIIRETTPYKAEIEGNHGRHEVNIDSKQCTCNFWQLSGLPCIHAVAFIGIKEYPLWHTYVDDYYHVIRYKMAYEGPISTLLDKDQWVVVNDELPIGVPKTLRPRGRPRKRRFKDFLETQKPKKVHKCGRCRLWGHHRSTCKQPLNAGSSQIVETDQDSILTPQQSSLGSRAKLPIRREGVVATSEDLMGIDADDPLIQL